MIDPKSDYVRRAIALVKAGAKTGTAFLVAEKYALTALHVIADRAKAAQGQQAFFTPIELFFHDAEFKCKAMPVEDCWNAQEDWVLLELVPSSTDIHPFPPDIRPLPLGALTNSEEQIDWKTYGYPRVAQGNSYFAGGKVRSPVATLEAVHTYQLFCEESAAGQGERLDGFSGAPCIVDGAAVGILRSALTKEQYSVDGDIVTLAVGGTLYACPITSLHARGRGYLPPIELSIGDIHAKAFIGYQRTIARLKSSLYRTLPFPKEINLDSLYVPLRFQEVNKNGSTSTLTLNDALKTAVNQSTKLHMLVKGVPGSGKSTLMRVLCQYIWQNQPNLGIECRFLPLILSLQSLARSQSHYLEGRIISALDDAWDFELESKLPEGFFQEWPSRYQVRWLLLLDGFDEINSNQRDEVCAWITSLLEHFDIIVTSRPIEISQSFSNRFKIFNIEALDSEQQTRLATNWLDSDANRFLQQLSSSRVSNIIDNPLLLTIAAIIFKQSKNKVIGEEVSGGRTTLYRRFVETWWDEAINRGILAELEQQLVDITLEALQQLAFIMIEQPDISRQALTESLGRFLSTNFAYSQLIGRKCAERFINVIGKRSGIFLATGEGCFWLHQTFCEYMAARSLEQIDPNTEEAWKILLSYAKPEREEVALFLIGIWSEKHNISPLLLKLTVSQNAYCMILAGGVIADGVSVDHDIAVKIIDILSQKALADAKDSIGARCPKVFKTGTEPVEILSRLRSHPCFQRLVNQLIDSMITLARTSTSSCYSLVSDLETLIGSTNLSELIDNTELPISPRYEIARRLTDSPSVPEQVKTKIKSWMYSLLDQQELSETMQMGILEVMASHQDELLLKLIANRSLPLTIRAYIPRLLAEHGMLDHLDTILINKDVENEIRAKTKALITAKFIENEIARVKQLAKAENWDSLCEILLSNEQYEKVQLEVLSLLEKGSRDTELVFLAHIKSLSIPIRLKCVKSVWSLGNPSQITEKLLLVLAELSEIEPNNLEIFKVRVPILSLGEQYDAAILDLNLILLEEPKSIWALATRGNMYRRKQQWSEAIRDLEGAIAIDPSDPWDHVRRGDVFWELDRWRDAVEAFCTAISLNSQEVWFHKYLGQSLCMCSRLREAMAVLNHALEADPDSISSWGYRAETFAASGAWNEAISDFNKALELDENCTWARRRKAECLFNGGRPEEALSEIHNLLEEDPNNEVWLAFSVQVQIRLNQLDQAKSNIEQLLTMDEEQPWYFYLSALAALRNKENECAQFLILKAIEKSIKCENLADARVRSNQALYHLSLGRYEQALQEYLRLLDDGEARYVFRYSLPECKDFLDNSLHDQDARNVLTQFEHQALARFPDFLHERITSMTWEDFVGNLVSETVQKSSDDLSFEELTEENIDDFFAEIKKLVDSYDSAETEKLVDSFVLNDYPFPMYCRLAVISGLHKQKEKAENILGGYAGHDLAIVIFKLDSTDRLYGQCNFKEDSDDDYNFKFCDNMETILTNDLDVFLSRHEFKLLLFIEEDLHGMFQTYIAEQGLNLDCRLVQHIDRE